MNLCYHPTKLTLPKFCSNIFTEPPKYVKLHVMAENSENRPEITEPCSRCSLPTGLEASDQKSENVKSSATPMTTYHPIFIIIGRVKMQLFPQKLWTCSNPLQSCGNWNFAPFLHGGLKIRETALHCCNYLIRQWNDWTELALLAVNARRSLGS